MIILAMDTTAKVSSVALLKDETILAEFNLNMNMVHSQTIMPMCKTILDMSKITLNEVDVFAVATGPGSFTGLRIGISAIKGMALAQNKPCVQVSTLQALAYNQLNFDGIVCAVMDARCNQVYNALFKSENGRLNRLCEDRAITIDDLKKELENYKENVIFVGDGADLCYNNINSQNYSISISNNRYQKASSVGLVANIKANENDFTDVMELKADYLRLPQAQRELLKRK